MKRIVLLGATGTVGSKVIEIVKENATEYNILGIAVNTNFHKALNICKRFNISNLCVYDHTKIQRDSIPPNINIYTGSKGLIDIASNLSYDLMINCMSGTASLEPTIKALVNSKNVAIANKEIIVIAGNILRQIADKYKANIIPIDSEHSAIMQLLHDKDNDIDKIHNVIITSSGGSLRDIDVKKYNSVTVERVLQHPNWSMGAKITVDSATLVNKVLEAIEAKYLFNIDLKKIKVVIHRESLVHGIIEYIDGNCKALLATNDMRIPINYAMSYPKRQPINMKQSFQYTNLSFEPVDLNKYPLFDIGVSVLKTGGNSIVIFNAANEAAVQKFLCGKIKFTAIKDIVAKILNHFPVEYNLDLERIVYLDKFIYTYTLDYIDNKYI